MSVCSSCGAEQVTTAYGYACSRSGSAEGKCDFAPETAVPSSAPETTTTAAAPTVELTADAAPTADAPTEDAVVVDPTPDPDEEEEGPSGEADSGGAESTPA